MSVQDCNIGKHAYEHQAMSGSRSYQVVKRSNVTTAKAKNKETDDSLESDEADGNMVRGAAKVVGCGLMVLRDC